MKRRGPKAVAEAEGRSGAWDKRAIKLHVSDHAVLRYLERRHGLDIEAVRRHLAGLAVNAAQLGAVAVHAENVRLFLRENQLGEDRPPLVTVSTVGTAAMRRGLGVEHGDE